MSNSDPKQLYAALTAKLVLLRRRARKIRKTMQNDIDREELEKTKKNIDAM